MSHGSSEEENYWPGYVDALTSMVQVLAFVMMLLAMAVFVLSQNVSKSAVQAIAKAAKMDVPADANVQQLTALVIDELDRLKAKAAPAGPEYKPPPKPSEAQAKASAEGAKPDAGKVETPKIDAPKPDAPKADGAPPDTAAPIATAPAIHSAANAKAPPKPADGKAVTLHFAARGFKLESAEDDAAGKFLDEGHHVDGKSHLVIRAYALASEGALSEARRLAYYRAMSVRKSLTDRKVEAANIRVLVLDTQDKAQGATADLFASDESAKN